MRLPIKPIFIASKCRKSTLSSPGTASRSNKARSRPILRERQPQNESRRDCIFADESPVGRELADFPGAERLGRRRGHRTHQMGRDEERKYSLEDANSGARAFQSG